MHNSVTTQISATMTSYCIRVILCLGFLFPGISGAAELKLRVLAGLGHTNTNFDFPGMDKTNYHYAVQLLTYIPGDRLQRGWGIEIGRHRTFKSDAGDVEYTSVGILVESKLFRKIVGQVGTVGYISEDDNDRKPFGLRASIGIERKIGDRLLISGRFRQDLIFDTESISASSLEVGLGFAF